ncbi:MAG: protein-L-isoaspartate O-methyltransferase [Candidatus Tokpelaia sp.]|uniref:protein-L-isoaspartate O-methyltransferase family protein n=1 Tax=Candidatus Tokpelaia sp. TaxID=2233777 RepID=UPI001238E8E2|nr:protein-L-isoaspartate O-methyltransferase [Candidatus Tokpelaia sp.]KAA6206367.1 MAG: protein-L-isoaspartate O-methyltransferase [Candidatus Tokpelaia sp.]KAA6207129.1 MAG: protein-L-isoaspartate O-methyltransferase [Candidatus Tokpelaia sp.]KAA6405980.1 protein-L-isoaspartate O-methyltransferase [Candidatus Tokpelaia sp.]
MNMDFVQLRQKMVDSQIRTVNVTRLSVLSAFLNMPRELFVPQKWRGAAYADGSVMVAAAKAGVPARYMMPPAALARLIQLADIGKDDFVLDIGAMTGYGAALMAELGSAVIALECDEELTAWTENLITAYKCENITVVKGNLPQGWTAQAPYDVILLEGAVDFVPEPLFAQLREGGRLIAVEGRGNAAVAWLYEREDGIVSRRRGFNLALEPLPGFTEKATFTF